MGTATTFKGMVLATSAAGLFLGAGLVSADNMSGSSESKVHCEGVNSCKGKGDCKGANNCKGQNSCKGQGFLNMSQEDCDAAKANMKEEMMKKS